MSGTKDHNEDSKKKNRTPEKPTLITEINDNMGGTGASIQEIDQHLLGEEIKPKCPEEFEGDTKKK